MPVENTNPKDSVLKGYSWGQSNPYSPIVVRGHRELSVGKRRFGKIWNNLEQISKLRPTVWFQQLALATASEFDQILTLFFLYWEHSATLNNNLGWYTLKMSHEPNGFIPLDSPCAQVSHRRASYSSCSHTGHHSQWDKPYRPMQQQASMVGS